ncbi:MAG: hypothetical protein U0Y82_04950 [Thermoleophilia bacterium]
MAPPPRLRVHQAACDPVCRIAPGPDGLRLVPAAAPQGERIDAPQLAPVVAAPYPTPAMLATAGGRILLTWGPGFARSVLSPDLAQAFDRRPPGMRDALAAGEANAALLRDDAGWRAVVLPSMGDRLPELGDGPVAIAPDGLRVAVADGARVVELALADGRRLAEHDGPCEALAYGRRCAARVRDGRADGGEPGPAVERAAGASGTDAVLGLHADGMCRLHTSEGAGAAWASPVGAPHTIAISGDGAWATLAGAEAVAVVRAADGAIAAHIGGACAVALTTGGRIAVGGEWGIALLGPPQ